MEQITPIQFSRSGRSWKPGAVTDVFDVLPPTVYTVCRDQHGQFFLEEIAEFVLPKKIYGSNSRYTDRILTTFQERKKATGVLLCGEKGSGKSLQAQTLSVEGIKRGIPTIVINAAWCGDPFNQFMQSIRQPVIVLFDEFEKVYDRESQEAILTLLDGMYPANKLYVFTINDKYKLDAHMRNRPGRIFYALDYGGMDQAFVREYCEDRLDNKTDLPTVLKVAMLFKDFNFDMLQALIEEMNRFKEPALIAVRMLNIKPEFDSLSGFVPEITLTRVTFVKLYGESWKGNPLSQTINIQFYCLPLGKTLKIDKGGDDNSVYDTASFEPKDMVEMLPEEGKFTFVNSLGDRLTLTRERPRRTEFFERM